MLRNGCNTSPPHKKQGSLTTSSTKIAIHCHNPISGAEKLTRSNFIPVFREVTFERHMNGKQAESRRWEKYRQTTEKCPRLDLGDKQANYGEKMGFGVIFLFVCDIFGLSVPHFRPWAIFYIRPFFIDAQTVKCKP